MKPTKITDKTIAQHYGLTQNTISNYKNATDKKRLVYEALRFTLESKNNDREIR